MARRSSWLNYDHGASDGAFRLYSRGNNAQVVGALFGVFALEHDTGLSKHRVLFYDTPALGNLLAESAWDDNANLPGTVTDDGGTAVEFAITIDGVY